jgi:hypothetical protein
MRAFAPVLVVTLLWSPVALAEGSLPGGSDPPTLTPTLAIDGYFAKHFAAPPNGVLVAQTAGSQNGEFALNVAAVGARLEHQRWAAHVGLWAGTMVDAINPDTGQKGYASPGVYKHIQIAHVGIKEGPFRVDVGLMPSHFGNESALTTSNWNYTHGLVADATPYYVSGVRGVYKPSDRLSFTLVAYNGWYALGNPNPYKSGGYRVEWHPTDTVAVANAAHVGVVGVYRDLRVFEDLVVTVDATSSLHFAVEAWAAIDKVEKDAIPGVARDDHKFAGAALWTKVDLSSLFFVAGRAEIVFDGYGQIVPVPDSVAIGATPMPTQIRAGTLTFGWTPHPNVVAKIEASDRNANHNLWLSADGAVKRNQVLSVASLAVAY